MGKGQILINALRVQNILSQIQKLKKKGGVGGKSIAGTVV